MIKIRHQDKIFTETKREKNKKGREIVFVQNTPDGPELKLHQILKFDPYAEVLQT